MTDDPIIDRSPAQKLMRVAVLRAELLELGFSVVKTEWLHSTLGEHKPRYIVMSDISPAARIIQRGV